MLIMLSDMFTVCWMVLFTVIKILKEPFGKIKEWRGKRTVIKQIKHENTFKKGN